MSDDAKRDMRNVMVLALADGKLSEGERRFIEQLRGKLGIDAEEFRDLVAEVRRNPKRVSMPTGPDEAAEALRLLAAAAMADATLSPDEEGLLRKLGRHVGLDETQVEQIIAGRASRDDEDRINARVDEIYGRFSAWDEPTRTAKIAELAGMGRPAVLALLRILESYRAPDGAPDALELKTLLVRQLGQLGDQRAVYYLCQQIDIADTDDEVTNAELRFAIAQAIGRIVGEEFTADPDGVEAARLWWRDKGRTQHDSLAL